ncbi:MAG: hypothetical protein R6U32_04420 [Candidatus Woesearchaeota archaeon]
MKVISETPITMAELKEDLSKIKERDGEVNFRANKTDEYINMFSTLDMKKAEELKSKIQALEVPRLKDEHILKIVDILPGSADEVKSVLQGFTITINQDNLKKIADAVSEYKNNK